MNALKQAIKTAVSAIAPNAFDTMQSIRCRRHIARLQQKWGLSLLTKQFVKKHGTTVRGGPFAGMRFTDRPTWCNVVSKLLGCYEAELNQQWTRLLTSRYDTILDIGCADGYYAVGFAIVQPQAMVYAYDIDPLSRRVTRAMSHDNGVGSRVRVGRRCTPAVLRERVCGRSLILSDCEGYESILIDTAAVPQLERATLVVELHEHFIPGLVAKLTNRLARTHRVHRIANAPRNPEKYPELAMFDSDDAFRLVQEIRPPGNDWLIAEPVAC